MKKIRITTVIAMISIIFFVACAPPIEDSNTKSYGSSNPEDSSAEDSSITLHEYKDFNIVAVDDLSNWCYVLVGTDGNLVDMECP